MDKKYLSNMALAHSSGQMHQSTSATGEMDLQQAEEHSFIQMETNT